MFSLPKIPFQILFLLLCSLITGGCGEGTSGPPRIQVQGEVTNNGEPLKVRPMVGRVQVTFIPVTEDGQPGDPQEAAIQPNGDFKVPGTDGKGIVAGKYKIVVRQWEEFPNKDVLKGRFDEKNTPIIRDITGEEDVIIDVGKE